MKNYDSLAEALDDLKNRGYEADFSTDIICLYCEELDIRLDPEDFHVDEVYRFDGDSNPDDNIDLYAISSLTGVKGTLVDGHGEYSKSLNFEMAKKLHAHHAMTDQ